MTAYTPEEDDTLRALYAQGLSFSQIGKAMGRTKGSAISRSRKLKLPPRGPDHISSMAVRAARNKHEAKTKSQPRRKRMETQTCDVPYLPIPDESRLASIIDATGCKWPVRDDAEFIGGIACCNHDAPDGAPYCEYHAKKAKASYSRTLISETLKSALYVYKRAA